MLPSPSNENSNKHSSTFKTERRDDWERSSHRGEADEREHRPDQRPRPDQRSRRRYKAHPAGHSKQAPAPHQSPPQAPYGHEYQQRYHHGRAPYPGPHGPMGPGPRGPPPPYYGASDHFRGMPPQYHQMQHLPHPGQAAPYGSYGHGPNMGARSGHPPSYHMYGGPYHHPPMGYHPGAPYPGMNMHPVASDSNSISSNKSKASRKSSKSQASTSSRKKRTIDGVHTSSTSETLPSAYSFRRTASSASSNSTLTAGNNTSLETQTVGDESPHKRDRPSSRSAHHLPTSAYGISINGASEEGRHHRRTNSGASTTSTLSASGYSLNSYEGPRDGHMMPDDAPMTKSSPKRRKGSDCEPLFVDNDSYNRSSIFKRRGGISAGVHASSFDRSIDGKESSRFQQLSMNDSYSKSNSGSIFLSLSTSPINAEIEATPISKNTRRKQEKQDQADAADSTAKFSPTNRAILSSPSDAPTPPLPGADTDLMTEEHMLNKHLRGQTFTPLPHLSESVGISPSNGFLSTLAPQLSWSIAGDTPSLEDLATCSWEETEQEEKKRPGSTTSHHSCSSRGLVISPHSFMMWKEEHESHHPKKEGSKDGDSIRFSVLSPSSDVEMVEGGTSTPLPMFFENAPTSVKDPDEKATDNCGEANREKSRAREDSNPIMEYSRPAAPNNYHPRHAPMHGYMPRDNMPPTPVYSASKPPTPLYPGSSMNFIRSPMHSETRDHHHPGFFKPPGMYHHPGVHTAHHDRVRNLRGRMPPGAHMQQMPVHMSGQMSQHALTSPMGVPSSKTPMWSPHHGGMPQAMHSSSPHHHHMSPINASQSKRKCVPLKQPLPTKFQGDVEKYKQAPIPEFTNLVNFPAHMSQKQSANLPEGMRCCVMCGTACPCSNGNKKKGKKADGSLAPRSNNAQDGGAMDKGGYAQIPTQNKGLCTLCDVNVWVVVSTGLEIKWCKGCKNFRPWAAFGDKGLATKCLRCRDRQREKYALQKEEKERSRTRQKQKSIKGET